MQLIDTHAHLYDAAFAAERPAVVARCQAAGVQRVYLPNLDVHTVAPMLALHHAYPRWCRPMLGLHPCHVKGDFQAQLTQLEGLLGKHPFCAIGEVGLDFYHDTRFRSQQLQALRVQLGWALQHRLPVVLHCRAALQEALALLSEPAYANLRGIFHCFSGTLAQGRRAIELGFLLGVGGVVTFKNAGLAEVVGQLPLQALVLETDSPYLAPTPHRGRRNDPSLLPYIAARVAELHATTPARVAAVTAALALQLLEK